MASGAALLGLRVEVLWEGTQLGDQWYAGIITEYDTVEHRHKVVYEDGDEGWYDLAEIRYRVISDATAAAAAATATARSDADADYQTRLDDAVGNADVESKAGEPSRGEHSVAGEAEGPTPMTRPPTAGASPGPRPPSQQMDEQQRVRMELVRRRIATMAVGEAPAGMTPSASSGSIQGRQPPPSPPPPPQSQPLVETAVRAEADEESQAGSLPSPTAGPARAESVVPDVAHSTRAGSQRTMVLAPQRAESAQLPQIEETQPQTSPAHTESEAQPHVALGSPEPPAPVQSAARQPEVEVAAEDARGVPEPELPAESGDHVPGAPLPEAPGVGPDREARLDELLRSLDESNAARIVEEFERAAPLEELVVASVSLEQVELQERAMESARLEEALREAGQYRQREERISVREHEARRRVIAEGAEQRRKLIVRQKQAAEVDRERAQRLHRLFERASEGMMRTLRRQQAVIKETYGDLVAESRLAARRFKVEWRGLPQPVEIRLDMLRALKDKVPGGRYVLLCQLYDRLGGHPLKWTSMSGKAGGVNRPGATRPVRHRGRFYDTELRVGQSVFCICPARWLTRPGMVFVFELFLLGGKHHPVDKVVAWSALPMCDADFNIVEGCFRLPMLRGEVDLEVDMHEGVEQAYTRDLDKWLANLYLEVKPLPRETLSEDGSIRKEYDVELAYTRELLQLEPGDRGSGSEGEEDEDADAQADGVDDRERGGQRDKRAAAASGPSALPPSATVASAATAATTAAAAGAGHVPTVSQLREQMRSSHGRRPVVSDSAVTVGANASAAAGIMRAPPQHADGVGTYAIPPAALAAASASGVGVGGKDRGLASAADASGGAPRAAAMSAADALDEKRAVVVSHELTALRAKESLASSSGTLSSYEYAVKRYNKLVTGAQSTEAARRLRYLQHEVLADLGLSRWYTLEFWVTILILLAAGWLRLYVHYIGQWLFLRGMRVPVYDFQAFMHTVLLKYVSKAIPVGVEVALVLVGPLFTIMCLVLFVMVAWLSRAVLGRFPETGSRFVSCFGIVTCLDPLLIMLVDVLSKNYNCEAKPACASDLASAACLCSEGDAFKLFYRFRWEEGSGVVGVFLTVFLYVSLFVFAAFLFYHYMLHMHMNGRMLDIYRRLHSPDDCFFVPHDFEMSVAELKWVCSKAARWRGARGTVRKVAVCNYVLTNPLDPKYREVTTHLALFNVELDGSRSLYRHFLRLPDGTILEMFGDMADKFGAKYDVLEQLLNASADEAAGAAGITSFFGGPDGGGQPRSPKHAQHVGKAMHDSAQIAEHRKRIAEARHREQLEFERERAAEEAAAASDAV